MSAKRMALTIIAAEVAFAASFVYAGATRLHGMALASPESQICTFDDGTPVPNAPACQLKNGVWHVKDIEGYR